MRKETPSKVVIIPKPPQGTTTKGSHESNDPIEQVKTVVPDENGRPLQSDPSKQEQDQTNDLPTLQK